MKEIYKKGTKVMGWINDSIIKNNEYYDKPLFGEILFYNNCTDIYGIKLSDKMFPRVVRRNEVTLFIQEIYDKAVNLYNEAQEHYKKFHECKLNMRKLLSSMEG